MFILELKNKNPYEQEFWNLLVFALTGNNLCDLTPSKQKEVLDNCRQFLLEYINKILDYKYQKSESLRLKTVIQTDLFGQKDKVKDVILSFFQLLEFQLNKEELGMKR